MIEIENTINETIDFVTQFCEENIPMFKKYGEIKSNVEFSDNTVEHSLTVKYRGKDLQDTEYARYELSLSKQLAEKYEEIGWVESED